MNRFFIPYSENQPAAFTIKGHKILILAPDEIEVARRLESVGADEVREILLSDDDSNALADLAAAVNAGVVVTPPDMSLEKMISDLEDDLPWLH